MENYLFYYYNQIGLPSLKLKEYSNKSKSYYINLIFKHLSIISSKDNIYNLLINININIIILLKI